MVGDVSRGYLLELLLTKLKFASRNGDIQFVGMSATLPNVEVLADWMGARLYTTDFRPVPLKEYLKVGSSIYASDCKTVAGELPKPRVQDGDHVVMLCNETVAAGHSVLIFCSSKKGCERCAMMISKVLPEVHGAYTEQVLDRRADLLASLKRTPGGLDETLRSTVPHGIAYHHAGLTTDERDLVEEAFRAGVLNILTATSTLAAGVNLPARRVLFRSPYIGCDFLDPTRYKQMCGRAGRAGKDTHGESFLICEQRDRRRAEELMQSPLAPLQSCLKSNQAVVERALVEVIGAGVVTLPEDVKNWLECTLLFHQSNWDEIHRIAKNALDYLEKNRFTQWTKDSRFVPTLLGSATFCSSLPPQSAIWVAGELTIARQNFVLDTDLHLIYQVTPVNEGPEPKWDMYPDLLARLSAKEKKVAKLIGIDEGQLIMWSNPNRRPKYGDSDKHVVRARRFYQALMLNELIREIPISSVADKFHVPRGNLQQLQTQAAQFAKLVSGFCGRLNWWDMEVLTAQFAKRINYGCQIDILPLCQIPYVRGARARALYNAGLRSVPAVATASMEVICDAIGAKSAFALRRSSAEAADKSDQARQLRSAAERDSLRVTLLVQGS